MWEGPYDWPFPAIHTALLPTGEVLQFTYKEPSGGAEGGVFDPIGFRLEPFEVEDNIFCGGHVLLPDGRLLVAGGTRSNGLIHTGIVDTHLFDPWARTWTSVEDMAAGPASFASSMQPSTSAV